MPTRVIAGPSTGAGPGGVLRHGNAHLVHHATLDVELRRIALPGWVREDTGMPHASKVTPSDGDGFDEHVSR
jgi:hypothetical protein